MQNEIMAQASSELDGALKNLAGQARHLSEITKDESLLPGLKLQQADAHGLRRKVGDLLSIAELLADTASIVSHEFDVFQMVGNLVHQFEEVYFENTGERIAVKAGGQCPPIVNVDLRRYQRNLEILLEHVLDTRGASSCEILLDARDGMLRTDVRFTPTTGWQHSPSANLSMNLVTLQSIAMGGGLDNEVLPEGQESLLFCVPIDWRTFCRRRDDAAFAHRQTTVFGC